MKNFFLFFLMVIISGSIKSQILPHDYDDYIRIPTSTLKSAAESQTLYVPNGGVFTPKGDLRVLIITVGFGEPFDTYNAGGWATGSNTFPDYLNNKTSFYTQASDFTTYANDGKNRNISKFYYEMSNKSFRIYADVYPTRININATGSSSWSQLNLKVMEKIKQTNPTFNFAPYDLHNNWPNYASDNSLSGSDNYPDYIVIAYRYDPGWSNQPVNDDPATTNKNESMKYWTGSGGGYSVLDGLSSFTFNGYSFDYAGYTNCLGGSDNFFHLFLHEGGHEIYGCPHYSGQNGVVGQYFYSPTIGWGMTNADGIFACALGWERWYLDWIPNIQANGVNSNINSATELPTSGEFTLRDYITSGDMIRIKIPNGTGRNQYLWIENHQGKSVFDNKIYNSFCGSPVSSAPRGIVAYLESMNDNKAITNIFDVGANAIKFLHGQGNYDYIPDQTPQFPSQICNNRSYNFNEGNGNPLSGQNRTDQLRNNFYRQYKDGNGNWVIDDSQNDEIINVSTYTNGRFGNAYNEQFGLILKNGVASLDYEMGKDINFQVGQKIGICSNPCLINFPLYNTSTSKINNFYLNGISFKVISQDVNGNIKVQVKFNDVDINQNVRWAGTSIILPDITGNSNPDVNLLSNITITIDKSGTPNRHTKSAFGDFVNPTVLTCAQNSLFKMQSNSKVDVNNYSTLILESGSTYEVNDGAVLSIKSNSTLQVKSGANLVVKGSGRVEIEAGAYICLESGANINLQDFLSVINLRNGCQIGVNPSVPGLTGNCSTSPASFTKTGNGSINTFSTNNYIQNQTFSINDYLTGFNIFAGTNVTTSKPQGPVFIQNGANVVFDADGDVILDKGFEVQLGAGFEAK